MSQWVSTAEHRELVLAKCVLLDVPFALSKNMVKALLEAGVELPAEVRSKFPGLGNNKVKEALR